MVYPVSINILFEITKIITRNHESFVGFIITIIIMSFGVYTGNIVNSEEHIEKKYSLLLPCPLCGCILQPLPFLPRISAV